jgi:hypothetical protein
MPSIYTKHNKKQEWMNFCHDNKDYVSLSHKHQENLLDLIQQILTS